MQRLEEIAEEMYQSSAAKVAKPEQEAVPDGATSAASEAAAEEGSRVLTLAIRGSCSDRYLQTAL